MSDGKIHRLVLWVPAPRSASEEERQKDPFGVFGIIGAEFPSGDSDDYACLCRKAKSDHVSEINRLFEDSVPSFETIDALD